MDNRVITLDNCEEWFYQQPEKLTFIEVNWQDDMCVLKVKQLENNGIKSLINLQNVKFTEWNLKTLTGNRIVGCILEKVNNV